MDITVIKEGTQSFNDSFQVAKNDPILYLLLLFVAVMLGLFVWLLLDASNSFKSNFTAMKDAIIKLPVLLSGDKDTNSQEHKALGDEVKSLKEEIKELKAILTSVFEKFFELLKNKNHK